jgi:hypothetical protein
MSLRAVAGIGIPVLIEEILSGSGTFSPTYPGVPAIIVMRSGAGGGNRSGNWSQYGGIVKSGAPSLNLKFFVENINTLDGVSYSVAATKVKGHGGYQGAFLVAAHYQADGAATSFGQTTIIGGGGAKYRRSSSIGNAPVSGSIHNPYPSNSGIVPEEAIFNSNLVDPWTHVAVSNVAGQTGLSYNTPTGGTTQTIFPSASIAAAGLLNVYYFT